MASKIKTLQDYYKNPVYPRTVATAVFTSSGETVEDALNRATGSASSMPILNATSSDGVTYKASFSGITALTVGLVIVVVPNKTSTTAAPKLQINSLKSSNIMQSTATDTATLAEAPNAGWMVANKPVMLMYDGTYWVRNVIYSNAGAVEGRVAALEEQLNSILEQEVALDCGVSE